MSREVSRAAATGAMIAAMDDGDARRGMRSAGRPTMADVARLAGVNTATVSRALAGSPLVTPETRQRVADAVRETGYVIHQAARNLRENRSRQVLVALPNIANPFFSAVVSGIEEVAQRAGFAVLLGNTEGRPDGEQKVARQLLTGAVDGLLVHIGRLPEDLQRIPDLARKVVVVANPVPGSGLTTVGIDETAAANDATAYLVSLGHRRIGHVGGPPNVNSADRLAGYRSALATAGLEPDDRLIRSGDNSVESGQAAARSILTASSPPTALFCANDAMAIGAIIAAKQLGLRVPADLSIVGFDDIEIAAFYDPPLTTIHQPRREIGKRSMSELVALLEGRRKTVGRRITLPHALIVRGSTQPPG
jgi:LacI family transcriptional regulator, repressor for deo operon, udp, cdd, tsx, nupC, and nupG